MTRASTPRALTCALAGVLAACGSACNVTSVTFHAGTFAGVRAEVDAEDGEVTLTRGAAIAFDCIESTELWRGPCRDFKLSVDDEDTATMLPALRLATGGEGVDVAERGDQRLQGTVEETVGVLVALEAGSTTATVASRSSDATFTVRVRDRPDSEPPDDGSND